MGDKWTKEIFTQFFRKISIESFLVEGGWTLALTIASRFLAAAFGFQPEEEWKFWLYSYLAFLAVILVFRSLFGRMSNTPNITAQIDSHIIAPMDPRMVGPNKDVTLGSTVFLIASIRNSGMPTIIENWEVGMVLSDGSHHRGDLYCIQSNITLDGRQGSKVFTPKDALYEKCVESPLRTGGMIRGLLLVVFDHIKPEIFSQPGHKMQLKFYDVFGKDYIAEAPTTVGPPGKLLHYPGTSLHYEATRS